MTGKLISYIVRLLLSLRYRIRITGLDEILKKGNGGIIFLPNHPAFIDPLITVTRFFPSFRPLVLADRDQVDLPVVRNLIRHLNVIMMSDPRVYRHSAIDEIADAMKASLETLKNGGNVMFYPAGHTSYTRHEDLGGTSAVETIIKGCPEARVVLVKIDGLWGSRFSRSAGVRPSFIDELKKGVLIILSNLILFTPRRRVNIECAEQPDFPRTGTRAEMNRFMENFYNRNLSPRLHVPYHLWQFGGARELPEVEITHGSHEAAETPEATRDLVLEYLRELTGIEEIKPDDHLSRDLSMDSLLKLELFTWLEQEFGITVSDPESVHTVTDVMHATRGATYSGAMITLNPVPRIWLTRNKKRIRTNIAPGATIGDVFLAQAKANASLPAVADQTRGVTTYRSLVLAIMVLRRPISLIEYKYVGIMLPSVSAVVPVFLATLFAGKIPVMVNWTAGMRNMKHSLSLLNVRKVLTSRAFLDKLEEQGMDLDPLGDLFLPLEELGAGIGTMSKIRALIMSRLSWRSLRRTRMNKTAVVLFTSGSENLPKAVPLSHDNILANLRDALDIFTIYNDDIFMGILPPFHSFGLTATVLLPVCCGIRTVYHPNPTEGMMIAKLIGAYHATWIVGTPTFLDSITRAASVDDLSTITYAITGGEKCPDKLFDFIASKWPSFIIIEGYGITECSPIVSVNRENDPRKGTIGKAMPSVEYVLRDPETGLRVAPGSAGMLLVRGPSIFSGYLNYSGESPFEEFEGKTWYRTGDIVAEDNEGIFTFRGRLKRFVKLGGEMVSLPAIEEVLLSAFRREDEEIPLAVESTGPETSPEIVLFTTKPVSREQANAAISAAGLSPIHNIRMVKSVDSIPLLGSGKTNYRELKSLL